MKILEKELGEIKVEPIKKLVLSQGFNKLYEIDPIKLHKEHLIKSKYTTELLK